MSTLCVLPFTKNAQRNRSKKQTPRRLKTNAAKTLVAVKWRVNWMEKIYNWLSMNTKRYVKNKLLTWLSPIIATQVKCVVSSRVK